MKPSELEGYLKTAVEAAQKAGALLREKWGGELVIEKKGDINLVTDVDRGAEKLVLDTLLGRYPTHSVLAEESGESAQHSDFQWIVDPLDGTTNFAHAYPCFCTSIALAVESKVQVGVVYEPILNQMFTAVRGQGAFLNNKKIRVSKAKTMIESLLCTGFAYSIEERRMNLGHFANFVLEAQGIRRDGAAAVDLCSVACGRFDGFWEFSLNAWDVAAGLLLIEEAGGKVTRFDGSAFGLHDRNVLATNGKIHDLMVEILQRKG